MIRAKVCCQKGTYPEGHAFKDERASASCITKRCQRGERAVVSEESEEQLNGIE